MVESAYSTLGRMPTLSSQQVKQWALDAGFARCGIARAHDLDQERRRFEDALSKGLHAEMAFLQREVEKRFNPSILLPNCRSVIVVLFSYLIADVPQSDRYRTARYTWVRDYHITVREQLERVVEEIQRAVPTAHCRITVDSSCISEKNWAVAAGVGCYGKNGLIHNDDGSFFVIGTILTDVEADFYDQTADSDCGNCRICQDRCPAQALSEAYRVDARKCFAYHTIENKNPDSETLKKSPGVFGCDVCQEVCPKNKKNIPIGTNVLKSSVFLRLQNEELENLSKDQFQRCFGDTAIARRKYERWMRAIETKKTQTQE